MIVGQRPRIIDLMGSLELSVAQAKGRTTTKGYLEVPDDEHPMSNKGWVLHHRKVLFDALGPDDQPCHWCGWVLPWRHENGALWCINVDHLDADRQNNLVENLVPSCWCCNANRAWKHLAPKVWKQLLRTFRDVPPWERKVIPWLAIELDRRL
jgi:hypothetical protein